MLGKSPKKQADLRIILKDYTGLLRSDYLLNIGLLVIKKISENQYNQRYRRALKTHAKRTRKFQYSVLNTRGNEAYIWSVIPK